VLFDQEVEHLPLCAM